jgi:hypothetical protein
MAALQAEAAGAILLFGSGHTTPPYILILFHNVKERVPAG